MPGPKAKEMIERRKNATPSAIGCVYPVVIKRGEGAIIEDVDGNKFLDWIGGVGVLNIGFSQPEVIEAVKGTKKKAFLQTVVPRRMKMRLKLQRLIQGTDL